MWHPFSNKILHFAILATKSEYIRFSEITGTFMFLLIPTQSCYILVRNFAYCPQNMTLQSVTGEKA